MALAQAHSTRFDGPPRVVALGFQVHRGLLGIPRDMFADPSFDRARDTANTVMDHLRQHGPFEPHRLPLPDPGVHDHARARGQARAAVGDGPGQSSPSTSLATANAELAAGTPQ